MNRPTPAARSPLTTAGRGGGAPRTGGVPHEPGLTAPRRENERGAAAIELALFLPMMALLIAMAVSATSLVSNQNHLNHVTESAARYATRAAGDPANPRPYGTAPTPPAIAAYVDEISDLPVVEVAVSPDPTLTYPGGDVTISVTLQHDAGPLGSVANAVSGLIGRDPVFPEGGMQLRSVATMRKE